MERPDDELRVGVGGHCRRRLAGIDDADEFGRLQPAQGQAVAVRRRGDTGHSAELRDGVNDPAYLEGVPFGIVNVAGQRNGRTGSILVGLFRRTVMAVIDCGKGLRPDSVSGCPYSRRHQVGIVVCKAVRNPVGQMSLYYTVPAVIFVGIAVLCAEDGDDAVVVDGCRQQLGILGRGDYALDPAADILDVAGLGPVFGLAGGRLADPHALQDGGSELVVPGLGHAAVRTLGPADGEVSFVIVTAGGESLRDSVERQDRQVILR